MKSEANCLNFKPLIFKGFANFFPFYDSSDITSANSCAGRGVFHTYFSNTNSCRSYGKGRSINRLLVDGKTDSYVTVFLFQIPELLEAA
ncbi:hypothetical protein [Thermaerobacillus caldiproteolyticus]|uniref:hypothetical protein n=1 Tax=Thermaerobacillus caldiproteolyticus TaxID=247480 RepID=UPI0015EBEC6D|nr:hypothetical protein [Anoxybacillus caldiproteolyticus]QPA31750.1 hypothetical protein ISX45_01675 [Anoxybacillus caldiproteolyticus]